MSTAELENGTGLLVTDGDLPEGWALGRVGDLFDLVNGYPFKPSQWKGQGRPIIRIKNLNNPNATFNRCPDHIPDKYLVQNGALLFAWSGTPGTSFGAHIWSGETGWLNQHIFRVDFNGHQLDKKFLRLAINVNLQDYIEQAHGGVGLAHITKSKFDASYLRVPPLAEQQRIVAKVEQLLSHVNDARTRLAKIPAILKRFRQAVLVAACSGRLTEEWRGTQIGLTPVSESVSGILQRKREGLSTESGSEETYEPREVESDSLPPLPEGWEYVSSDVLFSFVTSGSRGWAQYYADSGPIFLRIGNFGHGSIALDLSEIQHISPPAGLERKRTRVQEGDILISITADVGMVGLVPSDLGEAYVNQHVAIARPIDLWYSHYLAWYLASDGAQSQFQALQRGATKVGLGLDDIRSLAVPFPPKEDQQEIGRRLEDLLRLADAIESKVARACLWADKLTQAILSKALRGELVPTEAELARREGRDYEPTSVLLERIKRERESKESQKTKRRRLKQTQAGYGER